LASVASSLLDDDDEGEDEGPSSVSDFVSVGVGAGAAEVELVGLLETLGVSLAGGLLVLEVGNCGGARSREL
jgi:hypothetical protein